MPCPVPTVQVGMYGKVQVRLYGKVQVRMLSIRKIRIPQSKIKITRENSVQFRQTIDVVAPDYTMPK